MDRVVLGGCGSPGRLPPRYSSGQVVMGGVALDSLSKSFPIICCKRRKLECAVLGLWSTTATELVTGDSNFTPAGITHECSWQYFNFPPTRMTDALRSPVRATDQAREEPLRTSPPRSDPFSSRQDRQPRRD
ncbi:hypothetical protein E2C01_028621 [Portunus trituberculatus]|uniref:Uncharacterized protein n=1 Tax=Portunus trituberculatus TaxID=210409 RepID=A0A5B7EM08_PORTR|nr:hypothetical protein [Portunus trituberculatus]